MTRISTGTVGVTTLASMRMSSSGGMARNESTIRIITASTHFPE